MFPGHPERLKTFDYLGPHRYFLTFCTFKREPYFVAPESVDLVLQQILRSASEQRLALLAYCFMPDHLHVLAEGQTADADGRRFIKDAKQYSGFYFRRRFGRRLWQRYGYERTLRNEEDTLRVARYILENPLRARLAEAVEDYPFLGSGLYSVGQILEATALDPRSR